MTPINLSSEFLEEQQNWHRMHAYSSSLKTRLRVWRGVITKEMVSKRYYVITNHSQSPRDAVR